MIKNGVPDNFLILEHGYFTLSIVVGILQAIGKTLETAMFGMLLCAVYLKTKNFWAIAFVHAINDFIPFQNSIFLSSVPSTDYVHGGAIGIGMIVGYVVLLLLYIPLLLNKKNHERNENTGIWSFQGKLRLILNFFNYTIFVYYNLLINYRICYNIIIEKRCIYD